MKTAHIPVSIGHDFLKLDRPIIFFDCETTGVNVAESRIIELYATKIFPDGTTEDCHYLLNPGCNIPPDSTRIHGITEENVAGKPVFANIADNLATFFSGADLGGFNIHSFDIPLLVMEFSRCGLNPIKEQEVHVVDVCALFHKRFSRNLTSAVKYYCGEPYEEAHSAKHDVLATIKVLKYQLLMYDDLQPTSKSIHNYLFTRVVDASGKFLRNESGAIVFNFGKHRGALALSQPEYLEWMLGAEFSEDTKTVIRNILQLPVNDNHK